MLRFFVGYVIFLWCICGSVGCVSPSKYDVELANRQNDNMLTLMDTIEDQEDMLIGFIMLLEKRITMLEQGRMYMLAPNLGLADTIPQYLEPVEEPQEVKSLVGSFDFFLKEEEEFGTGGG